MFEDDKSYLQVFGSSRLTARSSDILLCYKIQFRIRRLVQEIVDKGSNKYAFAQRARNLIWALIFQGMQNDPSCESQREKYGQSLAIESGFATWIQTIASTRVRPLLSDLAAEPVNKAKIDDGRLDFLRTKATFDFCMERAYKRWKWVHCKLKG